MENSRAYPSCCCWPDPKCIVIRSAEYFIIRKLEASNDVVVVTLEHFGWTDWLTAPVHLNAMLSEERSLWLKSVWVIWSLGLFCSFNYFPSGWGRLQNCAIRSTGWSRTKWTTLCRFRGTARTACSNWQRGKQWEGCGGGFLRGWWCLKQRNRV